MFFCIFNILTNNNLNMKIFKKILLVTAVIITALFIIPLFLAKNYSVQKQIVIDKPINEVFEYISHLKNMDNYSAWAEMDPNMQKEFIGNDGTEGFIMAWQSDHKDVGVGQQEIDKIIPNKRVEFILRFYEPFEATDNGFYETETLSTNQTKVIWGYNGRIDYPMNILIPLMSLKKMIGDDFDKSLKKLKKHLEK